MDYDELINKLKIYEDENIMLKKELDEVKEHLKKYTAPVSKKEYYEKNKDIIKQKVNEYKKTYKPTDEQKKKWARTAYLNKKEKLKKDLENQNI